MTPPPRPAPSHVPTLTEVIELPATLPLTEAMVPAAATGAAVSDSSEVPPLPEAPSVMAQPPAGSPLANALAARPPAVSMPPAQPVPASSPQAASMPVPAPITPAPGSTPAATSTLPPRGIGPSGVDEAAMAQRVLTEVQRQIDGMLEYRLREALTPILARTAEALVRELRQELSKTMRDVVSRAVAQEVARQRSRP